MVKLINNYYENDDDRAVNSVDDAEWMVALIMVEKFMDVRRSGVEQESAIRTIINLY